MTASEASKTWFDEVVQYMLDTWQESFTWDETIDLCDKLTQFRDKVRMQKGIKTPQFHCDKCGIQHHPMTLAPISIRGLLIALQREGVITQDTYNYLIKDWLRFQCRNQLDVFGEKK